MNQSAKVIKAQRAALLKELEKVRKDKSELGQQVFALGHKINELKSEIAKCDAALKPIHDSEPFVTDHALIRYLARVEGLDTDAMKDALLTDEVLSAMRMGATKVTIDGVSYVLDGYTIVTII